MPESADVSEVEAITTILDQGRISRTTEAITGTFATCGMVWCFDGIACGVHSKNAVGLGTTIRIPLPARGYEVREVADDSPESSGLDDAG